MDNNPAPAAVPGRARARARGRARGQPPAEPARRPTDVPAMAQVPVPQAVVAAAQPLITSGSGRALHRGGGPQSVRPAEASLEAGMQQISLGDRSIGRGAMRVRPAAMAEANLRPTDCTDKRGTAGREVQLLTNYIKVESARGTDFIFYQYRVEFKPSVESPRMRRAMLFDHLDSIGRSFVFDGMEDLKTTTRLANDTTVLWVKRRTDDTDVEITLKLTGELNGNHPEVLRLMNTQQRKNFLHMNFVSLGRFCYDKGGSVQCPNFKLEIWPGFETAIRMHENSLLMVVDNIHKVLRLDTVRDQMQDIYVRNPENYRDICLRELVGVIVMTAYNNKTYSLDDFDFNKSPRDTFTSARTGETTYVDYYRRQYNLEIRDLQQPLIVCKPKDKDIRAGQRDSVYLIPELCVMTGLTDSMRQNFQLMKELAQTTRPDPSSRVAQVRNFIRRMASHEKVQSDLANWGIKYGDDLLRIKGRELPGEKIIQLPNEAGVPFENGDFTHKMRDRKLFTPKNMESFVVISTDRDRGAAQELCQMFMTVCGPMHMQVAPPEYVTVDQRVTSFVNACKMAKQKGKHLVVVIVPNNNKDRYDAIKKSCCIEHPIPSQVVVSRTLQKKGMLKSVATKIAIQINCKLGGSPWKIEIPFKVKFMIAGFDTYHDSAQRGRSAGALVATMNKDCTVWSSRTSFHRQREELSDQLYTNFVSLLKKFFEINKDLPELLLFYRDGVSDGQLQVVKDHEISQIYRAFHTLRPDVKPRLVFIVVNKRISTRFFAPQNQQMANPRPGTVVDSVITRPERYDFFLISQSVRQGTVSPTQFNVIEDTSGTKPDYIQRVSYKLCHMYYNWQGTIRVPAPCQYAHKLAFLVGQSLHNPPADYLNDKLYFL